MAFGSSSVPKRLLYTVWMVGGLILITSSGTSYIHVDGGPITRSRFAAPSYPQLRSTHTKQHCEQNDSKDQPATNVMSGVSPYFIFIGLMACAGAVSTITSGTAQHHDTKGVIHGLRARYNAKEHLPVLTEFFEGDSERTRNSIRERGSIYHQLLGSSSIGNKKAGAMQTGLATVGLASVAAACVVPNKDRLTSLCSNEGNLTEMVVGGVYEAKDDKGIWWPIKADAKNSDGSYKCDLVVRDYGFGGETAPNWSEVWPNNCRRVIRGDRVLPEFSNAIA